MKKITARMVKGQGLPGDVKTLQSVADNIEGKTICAFGEACAWPTQSFIDKFGDELKKSTSRKNLNKPTNPEAAIAAEGLAH